MAKIRLIANDIEIHGEKVARVLDISASLRIELEDFIDKADGYDDLLKESKKDLDEAYNSGRSDGYADGVTDGRSN